MSAAAWGARSLSPAGPFGRWLGRSSFDVLSRATPDRAVLVTGALVALLATANALVRLVLAAVGTEVDEPEQRLLGGRIIGPMERILIFGFAVAGQFTAAALVVSAKSLLRFPEDQPERQAHRRADGVLPRRFHEQLADRVGARRPAASLNARKATGPRALERW